MKLVVGLGNPGEKYLSTRHNVGFRVIEAIIQAQKLDSKIPKHYTKSKSEIYNFENLILVKPQTFMNSSGLAVRSLISSYPKISNSDLYIVHDDLDIPLGSYKIQFGKGPKVHGGISSIEKALKTKAFWRVRVGVENRAGGFRIAGETYVLQNFRKDELEIINKMINGVTEKLLKIA